MFCTILERFNLSFILFLFSMIGCTPDFVVNQLSHGPIFVLEDVNRVRDHFNVDGRLMARIEPLIVPDTSFQAVPVYINMRIT